MDILRLRKYYLSDRALFTIIITFLSFSHTIRASSNDIIEPEFDNQSLIQDISYIYELISDNQKIDCIGILNLSLNLPSDISTLVFERTSRFDKYDNPEKVHFSLKSVWPITTTDIIRPDIYWDTYFRIGVLKDNKFIYSPTYSVNDFINASDLELLRNIETASIEHVENDNKNVDIYIYGENLEISSQEPISLNVVDLYGRSIFNRDMVTNETIPLNNISSPYIIIKYQTTNNIITKKILLQ